MAAIHLIEQGESFSFVFDRDGEDITGWVCSIEVKQFPSDVPFIARIIPPEDGHWPGTLTSTETEPLPVGLYYLHADLTYAATDERELKQERIQVSPTWLT